MRLVRSATWGCRCQSRCGVPGNRTPKQVRAFKEAIYPALAARASAEGGGFADEASYVL